MYSIISKNHQAASLFALLLFTFVLTGESKTMGMYQKDSTTTGTTSTTIKSVLRGTSSNKRNKNEASTTSRRLMSCCKDFSVSSSSQVGNCCGDSSTCEDECIVKFRMSMLVCRRDQHSTCKTPSPTPSPTPSLTLFPASPFQSAATIGCAFNASDYEDKNDHCKENTAYEHGGPCGSTECNDAIGEECYTCPPPKNCLYYDECANNDVAFCADVSGCFEDRECPTITVTSTCDSSTTITLSSIGCGASNTGSITFNPNDPQYCPVP